MLIKPFNKGHMLNAASEHLYAQNFIFIKYIEHLKAIRCSLIKENNVESVNSFSDFNNQF